MTQNESNFQPPSLPEPKKSQSFWKLQIIKFIRGTIGLLESAVVKLETESTGDTEESLSLLQKLGLLWRKSLGTIRSLLPANLSTKLSDTVLTGSIIGITVIIWTTSTFFNSQSTEVAKSPTPQLTIPTPETTIFPTPQLTTPTPEVKETLPKPIPTPTPSELTPEQILIAAIENQVAEVSNRFASGLILSTQANFRTSNLTINISDDWYNLKPSGQNKLAAEILQRSQELDFTHLEIVDSQGRLIARNPVIGNEMIIFKHLYSQQSKVKSQ